MRASGEGAGEGNCKGSAGWVPGLQVRTACQAHESLNGDEALRNRVDRQEETFEGNCAEKRRPRGSDEARRCYLQTIQSKADLADGPYLPLAPRDDNRLGSDRSDLEAFGQGPRNDEQGGAGVYQKVDRLSHSCRSS